MSSTKTRSRGRPKVANEPTAVTVRIDASLVDVADTIAADLDRLAVPGLRHTRGDVMRAALARGIEAMRADVDARLTSARG
jgi:putative intracellular protease/amidase